MLSGFMPCVFMLTVFMLSVFMLTVFMLTVFMPSVFMLSVFMLSVFMLIVANKPIMLVIVMLSVMCQVLLTVVSHCGSEEDCEEINKIKKIPGSRIKAGTNFKNDLKFDHKF